MATAIISQLDSSLPFSRFRVQYHGPAFEWKGDILAEKSSRTQTIIVILVACLFLVAVRWQSIRDLISGGQFPEPAFQWQHSWPEAEKLAKEQSKPMLVVFSASWCPPCKTMKREVWPDAEVGKAVLAGYVPLYVDVDETEHAEKVSKYGVSGIPYVVVLDQDGNVLKSANFMSASEAVQFLAQK